MPVARPSTAASGVSAGPPASARGGERPVCALRQAGRRVAGEGVPVVDLALEVRGPVQPASRRPRSGRAAVGPRHRRRSSARRRRPRRRAGSAGPAACRPGARRPRRSRWRSTPMRQARPVARGCRPPPGRRPSSRWPACRILPTRRARSRRSSRSSPSPAPDGHAPRSTPRRSRSARRRLTESA